MRQMTSNCSRRTRLRRKRKKMRRMVASASFSHCSNVILTCSPICPSNCDVEICVEVTPHIPALSNIYMRLAYMIQVAKSSTYHQSDHQLPTCSWLLDFIPPLNPVTFETKHCPTFRQKIRSRLFQDHGCSSPIREVGHDQSHWPIDHGHPGDGRIRLGRRGDIPE